MRPFERLSIRGKLLIVILGIVLFVEVVLSALFMWTDWRNTRQQATSTVLTNARLIAEYSVAPLVFGDRDGGASVLRTARSVPNLSLAAVYDSAGNAFSFSGDTTSIDQFSFLDDRYNAHAQFVGDQLLASAPVQDVNGYYGHVHMVVDARPLTQELWRHLLWVVTISLFALLLSVGLAFILEGVISHPIENLARVTQDITRRADFSVCVTSSRTDEIGALYRDFNGLLQRIRDKEAERDAAEQALRLSETRMRTILDGMPDMIFAIGRDMVFHDAAGARESFMLEPHEFLGRRVEDVLPDDVAKGTQVAVAKALDSRRTQLYEYRLSFDGSTPGYFEARIIPSGHDEVFAVVRDVTDKRKAEAQLLQAQKMETVGALASGLAHDFNNVLAGISSTVSLLEMSLEDNNGKVTPEELDESLEIITMATNRAAEIVRQLLSFTRRQELTIAPVDLNVALRNAMTICRNSFDKSISLDFQPNSDPAMVGGDATQMEQVVLNLCVNAEHAMTFMRPAEQTRGGRLTVQILKVVVDDQFAQGHPESVVGKAYWRLRVSDTGVGMDRQTIRRIFDPFFTTKDRHRGTGLGLATVYNIVHLHNGFIDVYSDPGHGSTFSIYLPVLEFAVAEPTQVRAVRQRSSGHATVLVIDDEELIRKSAGRILLQAGYTVLIAEGGMEGIELYRRNRDTVDIVLLDLSMPHMSGRETYLALRQEKADVAVVMSSGLRQDPRVDESLEAGVLGFVQKPYTADALLSELDRVLEKRSPANH